MTDEDAYDLTFEGFMGMYDFAYGRESEFDDLDVGCVSVAACLALHKLKANPDLTDIGVGEIENMPIREMPETAERLRARLRPAFERAIAEAQQK